MPALNIVKDYIKDGYYHIFNRGVDKRKIFIDKKDYFFFLHLLNKYLTPPPPAPPAMPKEQPSKGLFLHKELEALAYCLMPNHFHLLIKQLTKDAITKLMRRVATTYSMYFNRKYKRTGSLFENVFKGILITNEDGILNVTNYIHLNHFELLPEKLSDEEALKKLIDYPYSSLGNYLGKRKTAWVKTEEILRLVGGKENYRKLLSKPLDLPVTFEDYLASLKVQAR